MADMVSVKTRAKIVRVIDTEKYTIVYIDADIPGIVGYADGTYRKGQVRRFVTTRGMSARYAVGRTIDIVSTWYNAGESYNGHVLKHDCYVRHFDFVD